MPHPLPVVRKALVNRMKEISTLLQLVFKLEKKKKRIWGKKSNSSVSEKTPCPLPLCILRNSLVLTEGKLSRC